MSRRLVWSLLLGVALSLAALIASRDQDAITNLLRHDIGSLAIKIVLVVFVGGLVLVVFRERLSKAIEAALFGLSSACCSLLATAIALNCAPLLIGSLPNWFPVT